MVAGHSVRVGMAIGFGAVLVILAFGAWVLHANVRNLFVGADHRISTSKTIAAVWTIVVAALLFAIVWANLFNHPQALNATNASGIIGQYAVLFGGPLGSAILAKQIVTSQVADDARVKTKGSPQAKDLIANDAGETDLGDFQYVLFNLVALFFVISTMLHHPLRGLPHIPDVLLGLTSVSAVGYVGKKALVPVGKVTAALRPTSGPAGTDARIVLTGLAATAQHISAWVRFGDTHDGQVVIDEDVTLSQSTLHFTTPTIDISKQKTVTVSVVTEDGAVVDAGTYTYT